MAHQNKKRYFNQVKKRLLQKQTSKQAFTCEEGQKLMQELKFRQQV
jgi:hypothetical protein